jgi:hypothetical protein
LIVLEHARRLGSEPCIGFIKVLIKVVGLVSNVGKESSNFNLAAVSLVVLVASTGADTLDAVDGVDEFIVIVFVTGVVEDFVPKVLVQEEFNGLGGLHLVTKLMVYFVNVFLIEDVVGFKGVLESELLVGETFVGQDEAALANTVVVEIDAFKLFDLKVAVVFTVLKEHADVGLLGLVVNEGTVSVISVKLVKVFEGADAENLIE